MVYYNEIDKFAAAWLRELIKAEVIADGEVDERDIREVQPQDLDGFTQCHFFAGIGVWSYALRCAGWPDDRPVWTGSCPCPSFSAAGKGKGFNDPRHLWPDWFRLIRECRPAIVFGEQVNGAIGHGWLDLVQSDLEAENYALGKAVLGACSVGAPHIRQRLYFVADHINGGPSVAGDLGQSTGDGRGEGRAESAGEQGRCDVAEHGELGHAQGETGEISICKRRPRQALSKLGGSSGLGGFWRDAEWLWCRDGKYRAVEPGTFPLAHGAPARVGRLRGYGNALVAPVAQAFIEAYMEVMA